MFALVKSTFVGSTRLSEGEAAYATGLASPIGVMIFENALSLTRAKDNMGHSTHRSMPPPKLIRKNDAATDRVRDRYTTGNALTY